MFQRGSQRSAERTSLRNTRRRSARREADADSSASDGEGSAQGISFLNPQGERSGSGSEGASPRAVSDAGSSRALSEASSGVSVQGGDHDDQGDHDWVGVSAPRVFHKSKSAKRMAGTGVREEEEKPEHKRIASYSTCKAYRMRRLRMGVLRHKTIAPESPWDLSGGINFDADADSQELRFGACRAVVNIVQVEVELGERKGHVLVFPFGCVVTWGMSHHQDKRVLRHFRAFEKEPTEIVEMDEFVFTAGDKTTVVDHVIVLERGDAFAMPRVVVSHAIAQSAKIAHFEERVEEAIKAMEPIAKELQRLGRLTSLTATNIGKQIGALFLLRSQLNLGDIADAPAFLWDHDKWESCHEDLVDFLDITKRVFQLNKRMDTLASLYDILRDEAHNRHSVRLEWIVIVLVALDCVLLFMPYLFDLVDEF